MLECDPASSYLVDDTVDALDLEIEDSERGGEVVPLGVQKDAGAITQRHLEPLERLVYRQSHCLSVKCASLPQVVDRIAAEYWVAILVSNTLGTALGDFVATSTALGFERGALVFAGLIVLVSLLYLFTSASRSLLF